MSDRPAPNSRPAPQPVHARAVHWPHPPDAAQFMREVLGSALEQVRANADAVAAGMGGPEHIHQLRVGLRRLRTVLRDCAALVPGLRGEWLAPLAQAFARLGALRDGQALGPVVAPLLRAAGAPLVDCHGATARRGRAAEALQVPGFGQALAGLEALVRGGEGFADLPPARTRQLLAARMARLHRQVMRHFDHLPVDEQHRVRKRLKRLRYLAEFTGPLWAGKAQRRYLRALEPAQDALGLHNDIAVAAGQFRAAARHDGRAWFGAGYLQAHLAVTARAARKALARVDRGPVLWRDQGV